MLRRLIQIVVVGPAFVGKAAEFAFDEGVDVSVHDVLDSAGLNAGSEIFHELIGLKDVVSDLGTEGDIGFLAVLAFEFCVFAIELHLLEFCREHSHGEGTVLCLGSFALAGGDQTGGLVPDADGGFDLIHVLSAFTAGAVGVDFDIGFCDFDGSGFWQLGDDVDGGEGGVSAFVGVEGGDADEAVDAAFGCEVTEGKLAGDANGGGFDAGFFTLLDIDDGGLESAPLAPALVHSEEHIGPVA